MHATMGEGASNGLNPIRLNSDLGEVQLVVYTVLLDEPLTREALGNIINGVDADALLVINNYTAPTASDLAYYLYLALRSVRDGVSIARDVNIEAMLYTQCTTQINDAKRLGDPLSSRVVTIAAMSIGRGVRVKLPNGDVYVGSVSRLSEARCSRAKVIEAVMGRARVKQLATND